MSKPPRKISVEPRKDSFSDEHQFFAGQIVCCDHGDSRIDATVRSKNQTAVQKTGKIRPCLVVGVDKIKKRLLLAPMSGMTQAQHPGWQALDLYPPIQHKGTTCIWVGTPAVTPMIFTDIQNMYWCPLHSESRPPVCDQNLRNYHLRHDAYVEEHGPDFDNSVPPSPRIHAANASRLPYNPAGPSSHHTAPQQRNQPQLTRAPPNPRAYTREQLNYQQLRPQQRQHVPAARNPAGPSSHYTTPQQRNQPQLTQAPLNLQAYTPHQYQQLHPQQQMAQQYDPAAPNPAGPYSHHMTQQQHAQPQLTQAPLHPQAHAQQQLAYQQQQMAQQHAAAQFQQQQQIAQQYAAQQQQQVAQQYAAARYSNQMQTPALNRDRPTYRAASLGA